MTQTDSNEREKVDIIDQPIPGPKPVNPEWILEPDPSRPVNSALFLGRFLLDLVRKPVFWFHDNVVIPNKGPKYYWYHRKYPRSLPIDECYLDDKTCILEANLDYIRTHAVDRQTLELLRERRDNCQLWMRTQKGKNHHAEECRGIQETYDREETNYHMKYGDLHLRASVVDAYNKQKMRMIVDRRRALRKKQEEEEAEMGRA